MPALRSIRIRLLLFFKEALTRLGAHVPSAALHQLQMAVNYMKLGRWMAARRFQAPLGRFNHREAVWEVVVNRVQDRVVLYLEFGVYEGVSIRYWSNALRNPQSSLHGFDSFEGLPEDFDIDGPYVKGAFDVGGRIPIVNDPRVVFHKGWFEDTVPSYLPPNHDVLVVCMDADLYSSTKLVLEHLRPWIKSGTFIYFDDMSRPDHEPRAFDEFMKATQLRFRLVATDRSLNTAAFECLG